MMQHTGFRPSIRALLAATTLPAMLALSAGAAQAQTAPFKEIIGNWSGNGTISLSNGTNERIRCQAAYSLGERPNNLRSALRCASDSYKFELNSDVTYEDGAISGAWREPSRNLAGRLTGTAKPGEFAAKIDTPGFNANLRLGTQGDRQSVSLRSEGTEISGVTITLSRR